MCGKGTPPGMGTVARTISASAGMESSGTAEKCQPGSQPLPYPRGGRPDTSQAIDGPVHHGLPSVRCSQHEHHLCTPDRGICSASPAVLVWASSQLVSRGAEHEQSRMGRRVSSQVDKEGEMAVHDTSREGRSQIDTIWPAHFHPNPGHTFQFLYLFGLAL